MRLAGAAITLFFFFARANTATAYSQAAGREDFLRPAADDLIRAYSLGFSSRQTPNSTSVTRAMWSPIQASPTCAPFFVAQTMHVALAYALVGENNCLLSGPIRLQTHVQRSLGRGQHPFVFRSGIWRRPDECLRKICTGIVPSRFCKCNGVA